jgi:RNA polymerase primary sigma factor
MARYHHKCIAELIHQLKLSPQRLRIKQLESTEYLIELIDSGKRYPYEFVCHHITGYRPKNAGYRAMSGKTLIEDLVLLVEELSVHPILPLDQMYLACWSTEELAERLKVSTKTICRWRRRGLPGRKLRYSDGTVRIAFTERCIRRFVYHNADLVKRGAAFRQLTKQEKEQIVQLAREKLAQRRMRLHELSQQISAEMGRAVETVRYTLRNYDRAHPEAALFGRDEEPVVNPEILGIYEAYRSGQSIEELGHKHGRSGEAIAAIIREVRARLLKAREIQYIYNSEFEAPDADKNILADPEEAEDRQPRRIEPPADLAPYLQDLYRQPLFTTEQERDNFRRYNYLKFKIDRLRRELDELHAKDDQLDKIEKLLVKAEEVKNQILRANLRLVVSIARRHVGQAPYFFEVVSDGNLCLMRAVEKFDYSRGFKFSTYASWAIMRNYARTIPEKMYAANRLVTGTEELLETAPAPDQTDQDSINEAARHTIKQGLHHLNDRERDIIVRHYGLNKHKKPMTLEQIGKIFGVTKERIRQIEQKALSKLRVALADEKEWGPS